MALNDIQHAELTKRLKGANEQLLNQACSLSRNISMPDRRRLRGKADGVRLALSYIEEITRENHDG